jgi:hypothetical protein
MADHVVMIAETMRYNRLVATGSLVDPQLDEWISRPALRVAHRVESSATPEQLWSAARGVSLAETGLLGRLVRWRIPGLERDESYDALFREPPFVVLDEGERALVSGLVGRIWTLRRDYPELHGAEAFRAWSARGTARVVFAHWAVPLSAGSAALQIEVRVEPFGTQGRLGVAAVRPIVRRFQHLVASEGIRAAVARAERG